jgi:rRNA-processing protein FCF1
LSQTIIFDTNFLLIPLRFGLDIFEEAEKAVNTKLIFAVTPQILEEIEKLKSNASLSFMKELRFLDKLLEKCVVLDELIYPNEKVDNSLVRIALEKDFIVATTDSELKKKLRKNNVDVIILRQKSYLELIGKSK